MIWQSLYRKPQALTVATGQRRIYAPAAYAIVREMPVVPIVAAEAARLAAYHPICWMQQRGKSEATFDLVVLRSLLADGAGQPPEAARSTAALPLALQAFPMVVRRDQAPGLNQIEEAFPDAPTDVGATILTSEGKPSRGAQQRLAIADGYAREEATSQAMGAMLANAGLMEPWPLQFDLGSGMQISRDDLYVVDFVALRARAGRSLRHELGSRGLQFLMLHRISLFRVSALLGTARRHVAEQQARQPQPDTRADELVRALA